MALNEQKTYDFSAPLKGLDGKPISEEILGRDVATVLARCNTDDPLKTMRWATELYTTGKVSLDLSDKNKLIAIVQQKMPAVSDLLRSAILQVISE